MESTFALNVLQKLDLCFTFTFFSIVLQGVADFESRIIFVDTGAYGKQSDRGIFFASTLFHFLQVFESTLPKPASFAGSGTEMPFVIPGDDPLKTYLIKPFARLCRVKNVFAITGCRKEMR